MKKIAITLLLGCSLSCFADCEKMQIDELKYMKKEELVNSYKNQMAYSNLNEQHIQKWQKLSDEAQAAGNLNSAISYNREAGKLINTNICYDQNKKNIQRVLEKDFKVTEKDLNKLINSSNTK